MITSPVGGKLCRIASNKTNLGLNFKFLSNLHILIQRLKKFPPYYKIMFINGRLHLTSSRTLSSTIASQALCI